MSRAALCFKEGNKRKYGDEITVKAVWSYVKKTLKGLIGNYWITFVLCIISVSLDPYICYVPSIDDENKLLKINSSLLITICVLYCSLLIYRISISFCENKRNWQIFNRAEPIALLFSNVLLYSLVLVPKMETSAPVFSVVLGIFLAVYLMRVIGIYRLYSEEVTRSISSKLAEAPLIKTTSTSQIAFNLLLFVYGGHLFGGLWYFFTVRKKLACWKQVCFEHDHQICHYANNRFNVNPEGNKLLSDTCFAKIKDTYELGIFKDAVESHIVEETSKLWKKVFYCFRWGIQNISGFGTNLQVSTYIWENIFVVLIAIYGVGTFTFFIGNMQNLIKSAIDERKKMVDQAIKVDRAIKEDRANKEDRAIKQPLQQWFAFGKLSKNLQKCIKEIHQTGGVDVNILFRNLPKDVGNNLKLELCLELLKKVGRFRRWSDASLLCLCDCIKPRVYAELTCIVREGDPIEEMLFVLHGKLWNLSSAASTTNKVSPLDRRKEMLKDGDFWGEELVNWVQHQSSFLSKTLISLQPKKKNYPISQTTLKALTKVEAFVLRIDDLQKLFSEKAKIIQSWFRKRKERDFYRVVLTAIKSNREQTPLGDQLTGTEIVV